MSPMKCTICALPNYKEIISLLKQGSSVNSISVRYKISYASLSRCWKEHTLIDPLSPSAILLEIKAQEKALVEVRKRAGEGSMEVHRIKQHLKSLREELRQTNAQQGGDSAVVKPSDPDTWPEWLAPFMLGYFDHIVEQADLQAAKTTLREAEAIQSLQKRTVTATTPKPEIEVPA